jgi:hypothetical protein
MDSKTNGAMPVSRVPDEIDHERNFYRYGTDGLTKRELFAAMAMQGLCANSDPKIYACGWPALIAGASVDMADALLAELAKATP